MLREKNWQAILNRDRGYDRLIVYYENISFKLGMTPKIYQQQGKTTQIGLTH